ncbi:MAG: CoA transferase, partial [Deltaproteobacteria bacterium]|nr:CoA transferase [Deltaproteobacteria bacterium]
PFGQTGPWRAYKATDIAGLALSNLMCLTGEPGEPPLQAPGELAYGMASTYGAFGIAIALYDREESGKGQEIDVSMHE